MARIEYLRHKKVNAAADDGVSEVQPQHWNLDAHNQIGILGFDNVNKLLSTGAFVISDTFQNIQAESGTADDLDTITATDAQVNDIVIIKADTGDTITVKHGTGNIQLPGGLDIVLDAAQLSRLILVYDGTNWRLPRVVGNAIVDDNGNEVIVIGKTASAVNQIKISNAATGNNPTLEPDGGDANAGVTIKKKGTGKNLIENTTIDIAGIFGLPQTILTIATGALAATVAPIAVAAQSGTADILDTITGLSNDDLVILFADAGDTITVTHDTGGADGIHLRHKIDIELSEDVPLILVRRGGEFYEIAGPEITKVVLALGKPADALATGDLQVDYPMEMKGILLKVKANVSTVSSSGLPTFAIRKDDGTPADVLSTNITIDTSEKTSETAATPPVINSSERVFAADDHVLIDVDVAGTGTLGAVVTLWFLNISDE